MPEVSEVALTAEILHSKIHNLTVQSVSFLTGRYQQPGRKPPDGYMNFFLSVKKHPYKIVKVDSKGKFLWFELKSTVKNKQQEYDNYYIMNTFGLTGMWGFQKKKNPRCVIKFTNGLKAYYHDIRNFGTFKFTNTKGVLDRKLRELAPDFLKETTQNYAKIRKIKKDIVTILMDQKLIGSGIGNYLVAEILYRAKIAPLRKGTSLTVSELSRLKKCTQYTVKLTYASNHTGYMDNLETEADRLARHNYMPKINLRNDDFEFRVYRQKFDSDQNKVSIAKINKRSVYWVPAVQK